MSDQRARERSATPETADDRSVTHDDHALLEGVHHVETFDESGTGIDWLVLDVTAALALAVFVFVFGPTVLILNLIPTMLGDYVSHLPDMAARTEASGLSRMADWLSAWTIFYWAWWVSWTPFVGMFIARISRGRTIREFITGVLLMPSLVSLIWFAIFGGAGIEAQRQFGDMAAKDGTVRRPSSWARCPRRAGWSRRARRSSSGVPSPVRWQPSCCWPASRPVVTCRLR